MMAANAANDGSGRCQPKFISDDEYRKNQEMASDGHAIAFLTKNFLRDGNLFVSLPNEKGEAGRTMLALCLQKGNKRTLDRWNMATNTACRRNGATRYACFRKS
jgi:hypothetical protein